MKSLQERYDEGIWCAIVIQSQSTSIIWHRKDMAQWDDVEGNDNLCDELI
jgi:hypothetical protein